MKLNEEEDQVEGACVISSLRLLHTWRTNLLETRRQLEETAHWNKLVREIEAPLANRDYVLVASSIDEMIRSEIAMQCMFGSDKRRKLIEGLQDKLEKDCKAALEDAVNKEDSERIKDFASIFKMVRCA
jgi:hypothetical protein